MFLWTKLQVSSQRKLKMAVGSPISTSSFSLTAGGAAEAGDSSHWRGPSPVPQHPFLGELHSTLHMGVRQDEKQGPQEQSQCFVWRSRDEQAPSPQETWQIQRLRATEGSCVTITWIQGPLTEEPLKKSLCKKKNGFLGSLWLADKRLWWLLPSRVECEWWRLGFMLPGITCPKSASYGHKTRTQSQVHTYPIFWWEHQVGGG